MTPHVPLNVVFSPKGPTEVKMFRTKSYTKLARKRGLHRRRNTVYVRTLDSAFC